MRKLFLLSALALFGAGCFSAPAPGPAPRPSGTVPAGHPPAVFMIVRDVDYPGVQGSYCYGGACVDKIGPPALVTEAGLESKEVTRNTDAYFSIEGEVFEFAVNIMDASGAALDVRMPVSFRDGYYTAKIPNVSGKHYLLAMVRLGASGGDDVSYVFPIDVK